MFGNRDEQLNRIIMEGDDEGPKDRFKRSVSERFLHELGLYQELKEILDEKRGFDATIEKNQKIRAFDNILIKKGIDPKEYFMWYVLQDSNPPERKLIFDTKDNDFENFIKELKQ